MNLFFRTVTIKTKAGDMSYLSRKPIIKDNFVVLRLKGGGIEEFHESEVKRVSWRSRGRKYTQKDITQVGF